VHGSWSGGREFVVRFTPTAEGRWTWTTASDDTGLNGQSGTVQCTAPRDGARGFVRRDPGHPYHFLHDDGSRYFLFGTTYYGLLHAATQGDRWKEAVDGTASKGMNKIRMNFSRESADGSAASPGPFRRTHDELDLAYWKKVDEVVEYLKGRGVVADLILVRSFGTQAQDERFVRYAVARYAAFPNVAWCLTNEWEYRGKPRDYWNTLGRIVRDGDPWLREGDRLRMLSIHQRTRIGWQFGDQDWPTHIIVQYGVRNPGGAGVSPPEVPSYRHGDQWGYESIRFNRGHKLPVVNDEYGYAGEPEDKSESPARPLTRDKHRHIMWGIYLAGGYGSAGDKYTHKDPPGRPYTGGAWKDIEEYGDIQRLIRFFTSRGIEYWKMRPDAAKSSVKERLYVLAWPGRQYVLYAAAGGKFSVKLAEGDYAARRYDPRTGEDVELGRVRGGGLTSFETPAGNDWVVYLTSQRQ
jgi:hypothetical protein